MYLSSSLSHLFDRCSDDSPAMFFLHVFFFREVQTPKKKKKMRVFHLEREKKTGRKEVTQVKNES